MTRYSDEELDTFKRLINEKLQTAEKELVIIRDQLEEFKSSESTSQGGDISEENSMGAEKDMLIQKAKRQLQFTKNLNNALIRIENKSYGVCSITGELIDKKRLMLVPHATKSIEGKQSSAAMTNANKGQARIIKPTSSKKIFTKPVSKATKSTSISSNKEKKVEKLIDAEFDEADILLEGVEELNLNRENEFEEE